MGGRKNPPLSIVWSCLPARSHSLPAFHKYRIPQPVPGKTLHRKSPHAAGLSSCAPSRRKARSFFSPLSDPRHLRDIPLPPCRYLVGAFVFVAHEIPRRALPVHDGVPQNAFPGTHIHAVHYLGVDLIDLRPHPTHLRFIDRRYCMDRKHFVLKTQRQKASRYKLKSLPLRKSPFKVTKMQKRQKSSSPSM